MTIPRPRFTSYMHERCELPRDTLQARLVRWEQQPVPVRALDAVVSRLVKRTGIFSGIRAVVSYKVLMRFFRFYFKAFNKLAISGVHNVPKNGCIFYVNHPGSYDPIIMGASIPNITFGAFVAWGNGWFADTIDDVFGMSNMRALDRQGAIEKMIRIILQKNRFFALWPEGHPHRGPIEQGFSPIVPVYAALNHDTDRIPFLPVLIKGEGAHRFGVSHVKGPVAIKFFKPVFLDRAWLRPPAEGGKTQREIIDHLMLILARANGQDGLARNPRIEWSRTFNQKREEFRQAIDQIRVVENELGQCTRCKEVTGAKHAVAATLLGSNVKSFVNDPTGIHRILQCTLCGSCYDVASREGKTRVDKLAGPKAFKRAVYHVLAGHGGTLVT